MGMGKGGGAIAPWGQGDQPFADSTKARISNLDLSQYGKPTGYENAAGAGLMNLDPKSVVAGLQGYLNSGLGNLGTAAGLAGGPGLGGADNYLSNTIGGQFLDVSGGPYAGRNAAIASEAQKFLNQNLDTIGASAERANGGVGAGSSETQAKSNAVVNSAQNVANTIAGLSAQDLARERGLQQQAAELGLNIPLQRAGVLGNLAGQYGSLGSIFGNTSNAASGLALNQFGALANLGNVLAGRDLQSQTIPLDYMIKYLTAARQGASQPSSGLGGLLGAIGGLASGVGKLYGSGIFGGE